MISTSIKEITTDLAKKTKEIDDIREKQEQLMTKFYDLCPQEHENHNAVMQFFEKRTKKRRKAEKRPDKEDDDEEDEDGEGEDEQEEFEDEEDSDGDEEDNLQALADGDLKIDQIESLREEKLDLHDAGEKILAHMH
jgi:arylsulfatase A-like enzyme